MVNEKEKLNEWSKMDFSEKQKYNGFRGFCNGILYKDNNAFSRHEKERLKKRLEKEKRWRERKKMENKINKFKRGGK